MSGDPRVLGLLEEILYSDKTPEDVCREAAAPELLPEVRRRWQEFQLIDAQVRTLLPGLVSPSNAETIRPLPAPGDLLQFPATTSWGSADTAGWGSFTGHVSSGQTAWWH